MSKKKTKAAEARTLPVVVETAVADHSKVERAQSIMQPAVRPNRTTVLPVDPKARPS